MLTCFNPKHLALAGMFLTAMLQAADAPATASAPAPALESQLTITTSQVNFSQAYQDTISRSNWMVMQVDFIAKAGPGIRWVNGVDVSVALGWGTKGTTPQVDLALSSTVHLVAIEPNKKSTVFFFVPPEILAQGVRGQAYDPTKPPTFFIIQYNGAAPTKQDYTTQTLPDGTYISGFLKLAAEKSQKGVLMSEADVPFYVLNGVITRAATSGSAFPTYIRQN